MTVTRRGFLGTLGAAGAAAALTPVAALAADTAPKPAAAKPAGHALPPLPYAYEALEPHIDAATMRLHHDIHHQAYVNGLIKAEEAIAAARVAGEYGMLQHWTRQAAFHGGGHFLHSLFWTVMAPPGNGGGGGPTGALAARLVQDFGSVEAFKAHFSAAANAVEGSGWALLHWRPADGRLVVLQAENQQKLSPWGVTPLLALDVWEHAYYLQYQNRRGDYVKAWWNVVNWTQVAENLQRAMT
jgi:Fe-Mn family superoxide dismutase